MEELFIYNTLTGKKEKFEPIQEGKIGMYVCGPTLYSEPHMGNLRTFINFDMIYRYLLHLGYQVKYVRNITDCGHITNSAGQELDSIGLAAKAEQMESLEIVYKYNAKFQDIQKAYNLLRPSIEPTATAHIQEQIEIIEKIIANGFAYVSNGTVYFDVDTYVKSNPYGAVSGRKIEELLSESRELQGQEEKRNPADFAIWKKANPEDMQIWRSPWGDGNPGWHIECTAMSTKYLGEEFDIHGGGMDLKFPHHENEVAQSCGAGMKNPAKYWMHANMLNVNGQKMSKSFGNYFLPFEILEGTTNIFTKPFSASVVRFFMMMGHYRSDLDFSNDALIAAEKGYDRLTEAFGKVSKLSASDSSNCIEAIAQVESNSAAAMNDDFNTSKLIAELFELATIINKIDSKDLIANQNDLTKINEIIQGYFVQVLGINFESNHSNQSQAMEHLMNLVIEIRKDSREKKDFATSDKIRDYLNQAGIELRDGKEGTSWKI
jgi:cysteinyl-tRNA synthetase